MSGFKKIKIEVGIWDGVYPDGTKVVDVARRNVEGTKNIPARDFRKLAMMMIKANCLPKFNKEITNSLKNNRSVPISSIQDICLEMQAEMKDAIIYFSFPPNAEATIKAKGFDDPLIDTKLLLHSVNYKYEVA
jgi:hypothetical protein